MAATAGAQLSSKSVVFPNGLSDGFSLDSYVTTPAGYSYSVVGDQSNCDLSVCEGSATAYRTTYTDGTSNDLCICNVQPVMSIDVTAQRFAKVAYRVRSNVIGITVASQSLASGGAYSSGDIIRMLQDANTEVFTHEAAHSLDGRNGYSGTSAFAAALNADTCVPDDYARSSNAEDFAQLVVTWTYMVLSGTVNDARFNCMRNQINFVKQYYTESDVRTLAQGSTASSNGPVTSTSNAPATSTSSGATCAQDYECGALGENFGYSRCILGQCRCGSGFSGSASSTDLCRCAGTVSYTSGSPVCLTAGTCEEDWQCYDGATNSQFVQCRSGRCTCRSGFQGSGRPDDKCRCQGTQSWLNGVPYCSQ